LSKTRAAYNLEMQGHRYNSHELARPKVLGVAV